MIKKKIDPSDRREYFYGESVHEYIGVLVEMILSSVLGGTQYHESRWPRFLDWGSQLLL